MKTIARMFILLLIIGLYGCASPVTKDQITPDLYELNEKNINLAVVEKRSYVLSGDKTEKFEGIIRAGFGIPMTADRPKRPESERFVDFLSNIIKDGFNNVGTEVNIVKLEKGAILEDVLKKIRMETGDKSVVVMLNQSNWDAGGFNFRYVYDFDVFIVNRSGDVIDRKNFNDDQANKPSDKYNIWDMHSIIYRKALEDAFRDDDIKAALDK